MAHFFCDRTSVKWLNIKLSNTLIYLHFVISIYSITARDCLIYFLYAFLKEKYNCLINLENILPRGFNKVVNQNTKELVTEIIITSFADFALGSNRLRFLKKYFSKICYKSGIIYIIFYHFFC